MKLKHIFAVMTAVLTTSGAFATGETVNPNDYKTVTSVSYVTAEVAKKQDEMSGTSGAAVTYTGNLGMVDEVAISGSLDGNGVTNDDLPTVGAVKAALTDIPNNLQGTQGYVVTYTGSDNGVSEKAIYAGAAYSTGTNGTANNLARASDINGAVTDAFNDHMTCAQCAGGAAASTCPAANCELWTVHNDLNDVYVPHTSVSQSAS